MGASLPDQWDKELDEAGERLWLTRSEVLAHIRDGLKCSEADSREILAESYEICRITAVWLDGSLEVDEQGCSIKVDAPPRRRDFWMDTPTSGDGDTFIVGGIGGQPIWRKPLFPRPLIGALVKDLRHASRRGILRIDFYERDLPVFPEMHSLLTSGVAKGRFTAARMVNHKACGNGNSDSIARRLVKNYEKWLKVTPKTGRAAL